MSKIHWRWLLPTLSGLLLTLAAHGTAWAQKVRLDTSMGEIVIELDAANTPDGTGYAVFGKVVSGMDVVDKIWAVPTGNKGLYQNVPVTPVLIRKASVEN